MAKCPTDINGIFAMFAVNPSSNVCEVEVGDCWIGLSIADTSGLILAARVGKHTDEPIEELVGSTEEENGL